MKDKSKPLTDDSRQWLAYFQPRTDAIVDTLCQLTEMESPSGSKPDVDRLATFVGREFAKLGGRVKRHPSGEYGDHLQVDFAGTQRKKPILLLGHLDTVYPLGTLKTMPSKIAKGRVWGPGALDMKSGVALMLQVLGGLQAKGLIRPVIVLLVSDEEVGSQSSRKITEALARKSAAVLVLEPSYGSQGAVKTARKGVGEYLINIDGVAAHSGLDFERGASAILELSRQIDAISKFVDLKRGITLNPGLIRGGTAVNVTAAKATVTFDVRVAKSSDAKVIDRQLRSLRPVDKRCKITVTGGINRPPMERTGGIAVLYSQAKAIAKDLGWKLEEAAVGGGSDGNFTSALGIPTLDGLGGVGEGAHAAHESIVIAELPRRAALLARLIEAI